MGRKRKFDKCDEARTLTLRLPDLQVISGEGDENHFVACLAEEPKCCPRCKNEKIERKETRTHIYNDAIPLGNGRFQFDELTFVFSKYRCTNPECKHVFTPPISFADPTTKGTYRFSEAVATSVMNMSYRRLSEKIPFSVTPQALGNTFREWYKQKDERYNTEKDGSLHTPSIIGIFIATTQKQVFTVLLDCDQQEVKVLNVVTEVGFDAIFKALAKYNKDSISSFVISCNQVIAEFLKYYYPGKYVFVPGLFLYQSALDDYCDYISTNFHNLTNRELNLLWDAPEGFPVSETNKQWVDGFLRKHPVLGETFDCVVKLKNIINSSWEYKDLFDWAQLLPEDAWRNLRPTDECVRFFKEQLIAGSIHQDELPASLYSQFGTFRKLIGRFDGSNPEVLRARILFANLTDDDSNEFIGAEGAISLDQVIKNLSLLQEIRPRTYNRRRK